jgi:glycosyltransferase involved in cell wall biosynthesis
VVEAPNRNLSESPDLVRDSPQFIAIVVPARNEEARIGTCLRRLGDARSHSSVRGVDVRIVLVLDGCTDNTAETALPLLGDTDRVVEISEANVGFARRLGFAEALAVVGPVSFERDAMWLATTDADSAVGPQWLARQMQWRSQGFAGVAGTVQVDSWNQHTSRTRRRYQAHMSRLGVGPGHPHVHGANLAFSASAYSAVGGMPPLTSGEDHALWTKLAEAGYRLAAVDDMPVVTSGRLTARAPSGFADLLGDFAAAPARGQTSSADGQRLAVPK